MYKIVYEKTEYGYQIKNNIFKNESLDNLDTLLGYLHEGIINDINQFSSSGINASFFEYDQEKNLVYLTTQYACDDPDLDPLVTDKDLLINLLKKFLEFKRKGVQEIVITQDGNVFDVEEHIPEK